MVSGQRCIETMLKRADDTWLVADSKEKLCRLVSEFCKESERRKLRVNVEKIKDMRCSRHGNVGGMIVRLIGIPLEEVDCVKYLEAQVTADEG